MKRRTRNQIAFAVNLLRMQAALDRPNTQQVWREMRGARIAKQLRQLRPEAIQAARVIVKLEL